MRVRVINALSDDLKKSKALNTWQRAHVCWSAIEQNKHQLAQFLAGLRAH